MGWLSQFASSLRTAARKVVASYRNRFVQTALDPQQNLGAWGEEIAVRFLRNKGYRIVQRGFSVNQGEIDIIALDRETIVFVEVKTWRVSAHGGPSDAVDEVKQSRITKAALCYLKKKRLLSQPARFDVVQILHADNAQPQIRHFIAAFEAVGKFQLYS